MKKIIRLSSVLLLGLMIFSSCSKQKYTASFSPSKTKVWNKEGKDVAKDNLASIKIAKESVVDEDAVVTTIAKAAPVVKKELVKSSNIDVNNNKLVTSTFTKQELKQNKKLIRKTLFKAAKNNLFHKNKSDVKSGSDKQLIALIISIFIPPLGVWFYQQDISNDFWWSFLFWILGILPGIIYAWLVILGKFSLA